MTLEVPYQAVHPLFGSGHYNPISIGQATPSCPDRSLWWLALAAVVGGVGGWQYAKSQKRRRR